MKKKSPLVFFNASVILAGLRSKRGGSGKVLAWAQKRKIKGVISEIVLDEVLRNVPKISLSKMTAAKRLKGVFPKVILAPRKERVKIYGPQVIDWGDAHLLASAKEAKVDFLVTLDQKHLLILKSKVKAFKIVTPGQLIEKLAKI